METLGDRIAASRTRSFVGRERYIEAFERLIAIDSDKVLLFVHGLGGVGKSTLLNYYAGMAHSLGMAVVSLDASALPADPTVIDAAIQEVSAVQFEAKQPALLLIDSFEYWQALETWFREQLLPNFPEHSRVVIAGRQSPSPEWQLDIGWQSMMSVQQLTLFNVEEARRYLSFRSIPEHRIDQVVQQAHQHPLALAMAADALEIEPDAEFQRGLGARLNKEVVQRLTSRCEQIAQVQALYISAIAAETNEALLGALLPAEDSRRLYQWLQRQSFMRSSAGGSTPHDLVRDLLLEDLLSQQPQQYQLWANSIFNRQFDAVLSLPGQNAQEAMQCVAAGMFALRAVPALRGFLATNMGTEIYFDRAHPDDIAQLDAAVLEHEGPESLHLFQLWREAQPQGLVVVRNSQDEIAGFALHLELQHSTAELRAQDPAVNALWEIFTAQAPLAEQVTRCCRFWMDLRTHQQPSPIATAIQNSCVAVVMTDRQLQCMSMVARADVEYWLQFAELADIHTPGQRDISVDGHSLQLFLNDWRGNKRIDWIRAFANRVTGMVAASCGTKLGSGDEIGPNENRQTPPNQDQFNQFATDALKQFHFTNKLETNPLLYSKLIESRLTEDKSLAARLKALRDVIREANSKLAASEATQLYSRVIERSYINPARSPQLAADAMGMGYSTYRRQRDKARSLLIAELRQYQV